LGLGFVTVKDQLGAARALVVDAPCDPDLLILGRLARLEVAELFDKLGVVVRDLELVRVRVRLGVLEQLIDVPGPDLVVLVGVEILLLLARRVLGLARCLGRCGSRLGRLVGLLLALLLALLQFRLGHTLARDFVEV
jgi:hypothetical protein